MTKKSLLTYDWSGSILDGTGLDKNALTELTSRLDAAREEVVKVDVPLWESGGDVPSEKQPLDAGFVDMPTKIWSEYKASGDKSELGRILASADKLKKVVDKVVVLGIGGSYMGARATMVA